MRHHKNLPDGTILVRMDEDEFIEAKRRARTRAPTLELTPAVRKPVRPAKVVSRRTRPIATNKNSTPAEVVRSIADLARDGLTTREIGARLGLPVCRVIRVAKRRGIELPIAVKGARRVSVLVGAAYVPALDVLANAASVSRAELVRRLLSVALEKGGKPAAQLLGPLAKPKRHYTPKRTPEQKEADRRAAEAAQAAAEAERLASLPEWLKAALAAGQHPLKAVRLHLGLRQRDVADAAGMGAYGENDIGDLERGGRPLAAKMAARLAAAMGVVPEWLATSLR